MIRRIILDNYMAHGRTVIEPAAGLTVLVGPNNSGKSAVVHALLTLCYNRPADYAVRHGHKDAAITVETDDGHTVIWRRSKGKVSYVIDGVEISRLRGDVPEQLHEVLRMPRIDPASDNADPFFIHFGLQKSPIFLLDEPGSRATTFFASSSDAEKLVQMQTRHREKTKDIRRELERLTGEIERLEAGVAASEPAVPLSRRLEQAEQMQQTLQARESQLARRKLLLEKLTQAVRQRDRAAREMAACEPLRSPPTLRLTEKLQGVAAALDAAAAELRGAERLLATVARLKPTPQLSDSAALRRVVESLSSAFADCELASRRSAVLERLPSPPAVRTVAIEAMQSRIDRLDAAIRRRNEIGHELLEAQSAMDVIRDQVGAWVAQHPQCPTCGGLTDADAVLAGQHLHEDAVRDSVGLEPPRPTLFPDAAQPGPRRARHAR